MLYFEKMILTKEIVKYARSRRGGWSMAQLNLLGIQKFESGWKKKVIGMEFNSDVIFDFVKIKNNHLDKKRSEDNLYLRHKGGEKIKNKKMEIGDKVKLTGTKITGVVIEFVGERDRMYGSLTMKQFVKVKHDHDGSEMEYMFNELRTIQD